MIPRKSAAIREFEFPNDTDLSEEEIEYRFGYQGSNPLICKKDVEIYVIDGQNRGARVSLSEEDTDLRPSTYSEELWINLEGVGWVRQHAESVSITLSIPVCP